MTEKGLDIISASAEETRFIGERLGKRLETGCVVALEGELGSGKTCLVQGIAKGLGIDPAIPVNSPSFVIINEYPGRLPLYHFDLYRLSDERELWELSWEDYLGRPGVVVIEWAERIGSLLPPGHVRVLLEITGENSRRIKIRGGRAEGVLKNI